MIRVPYPPEFLEFMKIRAKKNEWRDRAAPHPEKNFFVFIQILLNYRGTKLR